MTSYLRYKAEMAVLDKDEEIESWITVRGNHIPIKKGQSKEDAVEEFLFKRKEEAGYNVNTVKHEQREKAEKAGFSMSSMVEKKKKVAEATHEYNNANGEYEQYAQWNKERKERVDKKASGSKVYKNTMSKIRGFKAKSDGTFDFETGKPKDYPDGYSVSFHQNEPNADGSYKSDYGRYSDEDYDKNVKDLVSETGGELNIGYFAGTPEVSVWVKDRKMAVKMMKKHNQHSIWDWKKGDVIINKDYDPKKNPMKE